MRYFDLAGQLASLNELMANVEKAANGDINLMGHWGNYLCVFTAGYLENGLRSVYSDFVQNAASPQVARFSVSILESVTNPKANRFVEIARGFNPDWALRLEMYMDEDYGRRKNAVDSIMNNRHLIAHGKSTTVSVGRIKQYLPSCVEVIEFIRQQTAGANPPFGVGAGV